MIVKHLEVSYTLLSVALMSISTVPNLRGNMGWCFHGSPNVVVLQLCFSKGLPSACQRLGSMSVTLLYVLIIDGLRGLGLGLG